MPIPLVVDPTSIPCINRDHSTSPYFCNSPSLPAPARYHWCHLMLHQARTAGLPAQIADRSMTYLAQSLAVSSAGGNPDIGAFSGVMTALRKACGLISEGFQEACLDVEVVVQTTLAEATSHDRAFAAKATKT